MPTKVVFWLLSHWRRDREGKENMYADSTSSGTVTYI